MPSFPPDRFDDLPVDLDRVGAHRAPRKRGAGWTGFVWAVVATVVLIAIGAVWIVVLNNGLDFGSSPSAPPSTTATSGPTAAPTVDPSLTVTVLNGTSTAGLASGIADILTAAGWKVGATSNASTNDVAKTVVYYADAGLEGAARGVAGSIPGSTISLSQDFVDSASQLVVVLGSDYVPPAG